MTTIATQLLTVDDLATEITEAFSSSDPVSKSKAYRAINRALVLISRKGPWPFLKVEDQLLNTVTNQEKYYLPQNFKINSLLMHMRDPAYKLKFSDTRTLRRAYPNNTVLSGTPRLWRIVNFDSSAQAYQIALWPIPNAIYQIYMDAETNPVLYQDSTDQIQSAGIPADMTETIIDLSIALMYEKVDAELYTAKMQAAAAQLDADFYRFNNNYDADLTSRSYDGLYDIRREDPVLPPQYD